MKELIDQLADCQHDAQCEHRSKGWFGEGPPTQGTIGCKCFVRAAIRLGMDARAEHDLRPEVLAFARELDCVELPDNACEPITNVQAECVRLTKSVCEGKDAPENIRGWALRVAYRAMQLADGALGGE